MFRKLLFLNGLSILVIPIQHAAAYGLSAMFEWTDRYMPVEVPNFDQLWSPEYIFLSALRILSTFSVPCFLFISGFFIAFMARGKAQELKVRTLLPRIVTLLYPFMIWTFARFVLLRRLPRSVDDFLTPYNFVPLLMQFYFLSPFLVGWARRNWKTLLAATGVIQLVLASSRYLLGLGVEFTMAANVLDNSPRWFFLSSQIFWFPFGIVYGLNFPQFNAFILKHRRKWGIGMLVFGAITLAEYFLVDFLTGPEWIGPNFSGISRLAFILMTLLMMLSIEPGGFKYSKQISDIGGKSLGIYLANIPFIFVVAVFMYWFTPALLGIQVIYFLVLFTAGLFGPLALMWLVRKTSLRAGYRYLFG